MLPRPRPDTQAYNKMMEERFELFPECKENYHRYLKMLEHGYDINVDVMPVKMDYEVSSHCNFRCSMCLMTEIGTDRPPNMSFEEYKKSIDSQPGLIEVKLQGMGEPLLNPDFFKIAEYTVGNKIWARTVTNASLLHLNDNYKRIIDIGIGEIQISIDGATKETFESIRKGADFDVVIENCKMMNEYAESVGKKRVSSCWMLVQESNFHEVEKLIDLCAYMKFKRLTYSISISDWSKDNWKEINSGKEVNSLFTDEFAKKLIDKGDKLGVEVTFWDGKDKYHFDEKKDKICAWMFSRAFISADMRIVPCCVMCDPKTCDLGDARDFINAWNDEPYLNMREAHLSGNIPEICRNCYE